MKSMECAIATCSEDDRCRTSDAPYAPYAFENAATSRCLCGGKCVDSMHPHPPTIAISCQVETAKTAQFTLVFGQINKMGRLICNQGVRGSSPLAGTNKINHLQRFIGTTFVGVGEIVGSACSAARTSDRAT